jgi:hypothetical protein
MIQFQRAKMSSYHDKISNDKVRTKIGVSNASIEAIPKNDMVETTELLNSIVEILKDRTDMLDEIYEQMAQIGGKYSILEMELNHVPVNIVMRRKRDLFGFKQSLAVILPYEFEEYNKQRD